MPAAIVLAAGESSRLGAFKPLLPWPTPESAGSLVAFQVGQLLIAGYGPVIVVTGNRAEEVATAAEAAGGRAVHNPNFATGKATSVQVGALAAPEGVSLLVVGADQPRPAWLYQQLAEEPLVGHDLIIPTCGGRRGHPPLFAARLREELLAVQEGSFGLRAVVQRHDAGIRLVEIASPLVLLNINTPEDLATGRAMFQPSD